jgi:predicted RNA-binding protein with PIN domain
MDLLGAGKDSEVVEVFEFWKQFHSNSRARLDPARKKIIQSMLRVGYTVDDLRLAVLGCKESSFHQGDNDRQTRYCSVEIVFKNADNVDKFIDLAERAAEAMQRRATERAQVASTEGVPRGPVPTAARAAIDALLAKHRPKQSA